MKTRPDALQRLFELARGSAAEGRAAAAPPGFAPRVLRQFSKPVASDADIGVWERLAVRFFAGALVLAAVSVCVPLFSGERPVAPEEDAALEMVQVAFLER
jgi:hypothetical protein